MECSSSGHLTKDGYYKSDVESATTRMIMMTFSSLVGNQTEVTTGRHSGDWNDRSILHSIDLMEGHNLRFQNDSAGQCDSMKLTRCYAQPACTVNVLVNK